MRNAIILRHNGEVSEWPNELVLKTSDLRGSGGSNPPLSAIFILE